MATNPVRLEWSERDELEFMREFNEVHHNREYAFKKSEFDDYYIQTERDAVVLYHRDYLESDDLAI